MSGVTEVTAARDYEEALLVKAIVSRFIRRTRMRAVWRMNYIDATLRSGDVVVNSTAKSGQTLTIFLLRLIRAGGDVSKFKHQNQVMDCPWVEVAYPDDAPSGPGFVAVPRAVQIQRLEELPSPRVFKSHAPWDEVARSRTADVRYICITRFIFDLPFSFYKHQSAAAPEFLKYFQLPPFPSSFDEFFPVYLAKVLPTQIRFLNLFWKRRMDDNVLWLKFHELVGDRAAHILKMCDFLGWAKPTPTALQQILDCSTTTFMKANPHLLFSKNSFPSAAFVNTGGVGQNKNKLSAQQLEQLKVSVQKLVEFPDMLAELWPGCPADK